MPINALNRVSCDMEPQRGEGELNPTATKFRPKRIAPMVAKEINRVIVEEEGGYM